MRKFWVIVCAAGLVACSSGSGGGGNTTGGLSPSTPDGGSGSVDDCSIDAQKQFVFDAMSFWYFWNSSLPASINLADFATPRDVLTYLTGFAPNNIDRFSFLTTAAADQAFFGEGQFEGYGFGSRFEAEDDLRITRVFSGSPADNAGFERGQRIVSINGTAIADLGPSGFDAALDSPPVEFTMRNLDDSEFTVSVSTATVTIDPVPQYRIIDNNGVPTGYIELETFISTADARLDAAFADFVGAGVQNLIVDLRYNGGGLVSTAELLGDLLGGAIVPGGLLFSETVFNADRAENNFSELFETRPGSLSLINLAVIASRNTASASELVINSMEPTSAEVVVIGDRTFGKPVGQIGLEFCEQLLRPTAFQTLNGAGFGDYFDGLPADFAVDDDLTVAQGADNDPNVVAALNYFANGSFPQLRISDSKAADEERYVSPETGTGDTPARVYAGAR
jgi:C-terminal processing protease CtpA/Prc